MQAEDSSREITEEKFKCERLELQLTNKEESIS